MRGRKRDRLGRSPARALLLGWPVIVASAGCYQYTPVRTDAPPPGTRVRVELTDAGSVELASKVGPRVEAIEGVVRSASADTLPLAVSLTVDRAGRESDWKGESVLVPRSAMASLRQRTLSRGRSVAAFGVVLGLVVAAAIGSNLGGGDGGGGGGRLPPTGQ